MLAVLWEAERQLDEAKTKELEERDKLKLMQEEVVASWERKRCVSIHLENLFNPPQKIFFMRMSLLLFYIAFWRREKITFTRRTVIQDTRRPRTIEQRITRTSPEKTRIKPKNSWTWYFNQDNKSMYLKYKKNVNVLL